MDRYYRQVSHLGFRWQYKEFSGGKDATDTDSGLSLCLKRFL
jgi:hypothetical protein